MKKFIGLFILVIGLVMISGCTQPAQPAAVTTTVVTTVVPTVPHTTVANTVVPTVPPTVATPAPTKQPTTVATTPPKYYCDSNDCGYSSKNTHTGADCLD